MDVERAAREIVEALRAGEAERVLSLPAKLGALSHGLFPGFTAELLGLVNRCLPSAHGNEGDVRLKGEDSVSALSPSWLDAPRRARGQAQQPDRLIDRQRVLVAAPSGRRASSAVLRPGAAFLRIEPIAVHAARCSARACLHACDSSVTRRRALPGQGDAAEEGAVVHLGRAMPMRDRRHGQHRLLDDAVSGWGRRTCASYAPAHPPRSASLSRDGESGVGRPLRMNSGPAEQAYALIERQRLLCAVLPSYETRRRLAQVAASRIARSRRSGCGPRWVSLRSACYRAFVRVRPVTVGERAHRRGRRQHRRDPTGRPRDRVRPAVEAEPQEAVVEDQSWATVGVDHHGAGGAGTTMGAGDARRFESNSRVRPGRDEVPLGLEPLVRWRRQHPGPKG